MQLLTDLHLSVFSCEFSRAEKKSFALFSPWWTIIIRTSAAASSKYWIDAISLTNLSFSFSDILLETFFLLNAERRKTSFPFERVTATRASKRMKCVKENDFFVPWRNLFALSRSLCCSLSVFIASFVSQLVLSYQFDILFCGKQFSCLDWVVRWVFKCSRGNVYDFIMSSMWLNCCWFNRRKMKIIVSCDQVEKRSLSSPRGSFC